MADDINQIIEYLQTHRGTHEPAALRAQLLADGAAPAVVDAAMAEVFGAAPVTADVPVPAEGAAPEESVAQIVAYIRANRSTYDRVALRARLIQDGVAPAQADLALAQVYGYQELGVAPGTPESTRASRLAIILTVVFNFVGGFGLVGALFGSFSGFSPWLLPIGELVVGGVLIAQGKKALGKGILYGLLWTVILAVGLGLLAFGVCIVLLNGV